MLVLIMMICCLIWFVFVKWKVLLKIIGVKMQMIIVVKMKVLDWVWVIEFRFLVIFSDGSIKVIVVMVKKVLVKEFWLLNCCWQIKKVFNLVMINLVIKIGINIRVWGLINSLCRFNLVLVMMKKIGMKKLYLIEVSLFWVDLQGFNNFIIILVKKVFRMFLVFIVLVIRIRVKIKNIVNWIFNWVVVLVIWLN